MSETPQPQQITVNVETLLEQYDRHVAELTRRALFAENRLDSALRELAAERQRFADERQAMADADEALQQLNDSERRIPDDDSVLDDARRS